jgi:hypothetical protein
LGYLAADDKISILAESQELGRMLNALIASLKSVPSRRQLTTDN